MNQQPELYEYRAQEENPAKRFLLYRQVALLEVLAFLLIGIDFFTGNYQQVDARLLKLQPHTFEEKAITSFKVICTGFGSFTCTAGELKQIQEASQHIEGRHTNMLSIPVEMRVKNEPAMHWYVTGIYWPFCFFPLLGLLAAVLSLWVRVDNADDLGFKWAILATLMLAVSYAIIFFSR